MSFHNQGYWIAKDTESINENELAYENSSRVESKRSHQWFTDGPEVELFPNKKQAVEVPNCSLFTGMLSSNSNISPWGTASSFHAFPGNLTERLYDSEAARTVNFDDRNDLSVGTEKMMIGRKVSEDPCGNDFLFGLSMSHTVEDPRSDMNYGGLRKVKVNQVKDSDNSISASMGQAYSGGDNKSMSHSYNKGEENIISVEETYDRVDNSFMSMGQPYPDGQEGVPMGQAYKDSSNTMPICQLFREGADNVMSVGQTYPKGNDNTLFTGHLFGKAESSSMSMGHNFNKGDNNTFGHSFNKGESTIISFGGYDDDDTNASERLLSSYEALMGHSSLQRADALAQKDVVKSSPDAMAGTSQILVPGDENISKKKDDPKSSKKVPPNNFPSNVRSLLSTGMLDGVPVKYIAWSREKELHGVIKGSGYLCSCQSCNYSKVINAYEFERHAGCKTKHPNSHIYFENGKTIYGIVQELRSTPQSMLFDVIQTITGSPINQKSFRIWKESFLAATRELQRIYGKDEGKQLS